MSGRTVKARGVYKCHSVSYVDHTTWGHREIVNGSKQAVRRESLVDPKVRTYRHHLPNIAKVLGPPC